MSPTVHLPVINKLVISNYPLYPGKRKPGVTIIFRKGISVIAGINGVGKTTLVTMMLRLLLGPFDPVKAKSREAGKATAKGLALIRKFSYFTDRVAAGGAEDAEASLSFTLGGKSIEVTRKLSDLSIKRIAFGRSLKARPTEELFTDLVVQYSGVATAYDFHLLVRYFQFFTEERSPILWSTQAQFDLFKQLFAPHELADSLNDLGAKIQKIDTDYRNRTYQNNKRKIEAVESQKQKETAQVDVSVLRTAITGELRLLKKCQEEFRSARMQITSLRSLRDDHRSLVESLQASLDVEAQNLSGLDAAWIIQALPSSDAKAQFLMQGFQSHAGCFVCGKNDQVQRDAIIKKYKSNRCIVCGTANSARPNTKLSARDVRSAEKRFALLENQLSDATKQLNATQVDLAERERAAAAAAQALLESRTRLTDLESKLPANDFETENAFAEYEQEKALLDGMAVTRASLTDHLRDRVAELDKALAPVQETIGVAFKKYAERFLHEQVDIVFSRATSLSLGTGAGRAYVPTFRIKMTSATHAVSSLRATSKSVSESQKEFLDLAFRMALLDCISAGFPTMLVMETPEASLDTWFMRRAAQLMREFAPELGGRKNTLIATSNLNGTLMIPELLGAVGPRGGIQPISKDNRSRFIDLMEIAATPGVLNSPEALKAFRIEKAKYLQ